MMRMAVAFVLCAAAACAQSTQGFITGSFVNTLSGQPVPGARITWTHQNTGLQGADWSDTGGLYHLPTLSPGTYLLRVTADGYQSQEVHDLVLAVAGRLEVNFRLRPLQDVWEQGSTRSLLLQGSRILLNFFGPDMEAGRSATIDGRRSTSGALESTVSEVVDPVSIRDLPFAGRDVYTALVLMPGVTSDGATARGLGLAVAGHRPSSSNFFLDGIEYNNYLTSGPLAPVAPEAVQEYRVSINNYSAQYGGSAGFVANAATRAGGPAFHGSIYLYLQNSALNANDFQRNLSGFGRASGRIAQPGFQVGGPILKRKALFFSSAYENLHSRTELIPTDYKLPTGSFVASLRSDSIAHQLLTEHPSLASNITGPASATLRLAPPITIDRSLALERVDYSTQDGRQRLSGRVALIRSRQPNFIWSPFKDLSSQQDHDITSIAVTHFYNLGPRLTNEAKVGISPGNLGWDRAEASIPNLFALDGTTLPSNPAVYSYGNNTRSLQFLDNLTWVHGRHVFTAGFGGLWRWLDAYLSPGEDGAFTFADTRAFGSDAPLLYTGARSYTALPSIASANFDHGYKVRDLSAFVQDSFRVSSRLTLNAGLRYEYFGAPSSGAAPEVPTIVLGAGVSVRERFSNAVLAAPGKGKPWLFRSSALNWEPRIGASYDVWGSGRTIIRGGFGSYSDRLYDNLWETAGLNDIATPLWVAANSATTAYLSPIETVLQRFIRVGVTDPRITAFDPDLKPGRSYNYFAGFQHQLSPSVSMEVNGLGSAGRDLVTTDVVNRSPVLPEFSIINLRIPFNVRFRGSQGASDYQALTATATYRSTHAQFRFSYTWSHSIDNQSEPLDSDLFDFRGNAGGTQIGFARQFDQTGDRGNSDFDQRHNLVFYSIWQSPSSLGRGWGRSLLKDWRLAQMAAFRTGFPFSVYALGGRADIVDPSQLNFRSTDVTGGETLLSRSGLTSPVPNSGRNSGRNAFSGPGIYNLDVSVARVFPLRWLGESGRFVFRADFFNLLNHANLGTPDNALTSPSFGVSLFGRTGIRSGFPASTPLVETPRHIQMSLRIEF
jgi:hypothetical protein